jgi:plastocyanin
MKKTSVALALTFALAACGGSSTPKAGGTSPGNPTTCTPAGTSLQIVAKNLLFDKSCLAAPAGQAFTIALDNQDKALLHNIAIYTADPAMSSGAKNLFLGDKFAGVKTTNYNVPSIAAGTYFFRCEVHPGQMKGTFVVK